MTWYSTCLVLLFLFRTNGKKGHLDKNDFRQCYGNFFSKVAFWTLLDHSYVQSPFSTNTRHFDNSNLKDTLQFFILRAWINMRAKSFIKILVNVTETRIDEGTWKKTVAQSEHLEEHCTSIETTFRLFYALLFLTNLGIFFYYVNHNLLFCLLINIWYITDLEVYLVPLRFFMRLGVLLLKVFRFKML